MFRRRRGPGIGILLLVAQLFQVGFNRIPPVTLGVIGLNTAVFLRLLNGLPKVSKACVSFHHVWYNEEWRRIILSPFFHLDDMHLYFNMASFLWKGISLESRLGSRGLFYLISVFSILTSLMLLVLDKCLATVLADTSYLYTCAAGFSGVIFALKVVTTYHLPPGITNVMMFPVPSRIACWVELILIQLLVPNASFTGHLAGILVGLLYVKGPLKMLMASFGNIVYGERHAGPSYTYRSDRSGRASQRFVNDDEDEDFQAAVRESLLEQSKRSENTRPGESQTDTPQNDLSDPHLNSEEVRRRRLRRFNQT